MSELIDNDTQRREDLLKHGTTGPPKVRWGKHDEARALLH